MHATQKNQLGSVVGSGKYNQVGSAKKIDSVLLKLSSHGSVKQLSLLWKETELVHLKNWLDCAKNWVDSVKNQIGFKIAITYCRE